MSTRVVVAAEQLRRPVPGGIGRYAECLLGALTAASATAADGPAGMPSVTVYASRHRGAGPDPLARFGLAVRTSPLPAPLLTLAWDRGLAPVGVPASVVHAVSLPAPPVVPLRRAGGAAVVVMVHDLAWRAQPEATTSRGRRWHEAALRRALRVADALVVPSRAVADELVAAGAADDRVRVIGHGADHLGASDEAGADSLLRRLGVDGPFFLSAGTLEPRKNLARLVAAYSAARSALPASWPLVVVGPAGWGEHGLGDPPAVLAAGAVTDGVLSALYGRARAFCYVPLVEGFGLPPVEAMAAGGVVVASATVPSMARPSSPSSSSPSSSSPSSSPPPDEAPALLVDPWSPDDIAAALVRVGTDDRLRQELVARGRAHVAPMTWARCAREHVALWESLA